MKAALDHSKGMGTDLQGFENDIVPLKPEAMMDSA